MNSARTSPHSGITSLQSWTTRSWTLPTGADTALLLGGKLNSYLAEVDSRAGQMLDSLVTRMAAGDGITEQLKAQDQMAWVQRMNAVRNAAEEIVNNEVIFV